MPEIKIENGNAEIDAIISALEASGWKTSVSITVTRELPVTEVRASDCYECPAILCTAQCQKEHHLARLMDTYNEQVAALAETEALLREVAIHGCN